jgi:hypothetical protein
VQHVETGTRIRASTRSWRNGRWSCAQSARLLRVTSRHLRSAKHYEYSLYKETFFPLKLHQSHPSQSFISKPIINMKLTTALCIIGFAKLVSVSLQLISY